MTSKSCGVEEDTWRIGTIVCGGIGIGWGVLITIAAIVLMALAGTHGSQICEEYFSRVNSTNLAELAQSQNQTIPNFPFSSLDVCKSSIFIGFIIAGVIIFIVALLFWIIPGSLAVCGAQNKSTGLVCAYIVCLVLLLVIDIIGIIGSIVAQSQAGEENLDLYSNKENLIISAVGIFLTVLAIVVAGNYRNAVKAEEHTVALI